VLAALATSAAPVLTRHIEAPVELAAFAATGFTPCGERCFVGVETGDRFHLVQADVAPVSGDDYRVSLSLRRLPGAAVTLGGDFYAPGYDDGDQQELVPLGMAALERGVTLRWNADEAPARAYVRLFYTGPPGVEIADIRLVRAPAWLEAAQRALAIVAVSAAVAGAVLLAVALRRRLAAAPWRRELAPLAALYAALVPLRTLQYAVTPPWAGDEYAYKMIAAGFWWLGGVGAGGLGADRIGHSVAFPNLVYPVLIAPAFAFGTEFHLALRAIDAALLCAGVFPAYALARRFLAPGWSLAFAAFAVTIPFVNLGAYALTEVAFYPLFLAWAWAALRALAPGAGLGWPAAAGALAGVLANVRPNGAGLVVVTGFALLLVAWAERRPARGALVAAGLVVPAAFLALGTLLHAATHGALLPEPGLYGEMQQKGAAGAATFPWSAYLDLGLGHLAGLAIPYALPLALVAAALPDAVRGRWRDEGARVVVLATLAAALLVASAFAQTLMVASFDLGGLGRWHARYYFHATPLLLLAGVAAARRPGFGADRERALVLSIVAVVLALGGVFVFGREAFESPWFGSIVDGMDVQWLTRHDRLFLVFAAATLGVAGLVCARSARAATFATLALVAWLVVANRGVLSTARLGRADPAAACGHMAAHLLENAPGRFAIAGGERGEAVRAGFAIPFLPERVVWGGDLAREAGAEVWHRVDYVVTYGRVAPAEGWRPVLEAGACRVYRAR